MTKNIIYIAIVTLLCASSIFSQTPTPTPMSSPLPQVLPTPASLETILAEAVKQTDFYKETFNNLLAVETKTFEQFDKNGEVKNEKTVESNFFVYQSSKSADVLSELRNVVKVDDKLVPDSQARADRFLGELQKTSTVEKELEKIQDEGLRYDKTIRISGFTLYEGVALADNLRSVFDFKLLGKEDYQGSEVYIVSYQQTKTSPFIAINEKTTSEKGLKLDFDVSIPGALKKNDKFLRGKFWLDATTFQIRREERQVVVQTANPIVAQETILEYQSSEFGILVPKKITFVENDIKKTSKDSEFTAVKDTRITFDYSQFRKSDTDVKLLDDN